MGKKVIFPLQSHISDSFVGEQWRSGARSAVKKNLPGILTCTDVETGDYASMGWRSRRTSHTCEITYWGHTSDELLVAVLRAIVQASILESRKRVEIYNEYPEIDDLIKQSGFVFEGFHQDYTKDFRDVNIYGWVPILDGVPDVQSDIQVYHISSADVVMYREKNIELYKKDTDYFQEMTTEGGTKTFSQILDEHYEEVLQQDNVQIVHEPDWNGNFKKTSVLSSVSPDGLLFERTV